MKIQYDITYCNECPYFREHVDYSVCEDSFDEPNYNFYCQHENADNQNTKQAALNDIRYGLFIERSYSQFQKNCDIPDWCPFKKF